MNALEKVVDLLTVIVILFFLPLLFYNGKQRNLETIMVGQRGKYFLNHVSVQGQITLPVWNELERQLAAYGCTEFSLYRERSVYEPTGNPGEIREKTYRLEKEEIEKQLREQGTCLLQKGDRLCLTLYKNQIPVKYYEYIRTGAAKG